MLRALLRGEQNAEQMAELALGVLRKKLPELQRLWRVTARRITASCWSDC
jgi:hypothetical protein